MIVLTFWSLLPAVILSIVGIYVLRDSRTDYEIDHDAHIASSEHDEILRALDAEFPAALAVPQSGFSLGPSVLARELPASSIGAQIGLSPGSGLVCPRPNQERPIVDLGPGRQARLPPGLVQINYLTDEYLFENGVKVTRAEYEDILRRLRG